MQTDANDLQREETEIAIQSQIPVSFEAFFPRGAFVVGEVEPIVKWSDDGQPQGQDLDKASGHPLWQVRVIDADPDAKKGQGEVTVKIASILEPALDGVSYDVLFASELGDSQRREWNLPPRGTSCACTLCSCVNEADVGSVEHPICGCCLADCPDVHQDAEIDSK